MNKIKDFRRTSKPIYSKLLTLAKQKFGELSEVDKKFFVCVANNEIADFSSKNEEENDPILAEKWDHNRIINSDRLAWLCTDIKASPFVGNQGISIVGLRIEGNLNLQFTNIPFQLSFKGCFFSCLIDLTLANISILKMPSTYTSKITANHLKVEGSLFLNNGFKANDEVCLKEANIGGSLVFNNGNFINGSHKALDIEQTNIKGSVFLSNKFKAEGEVYAKGITVGGNFECSNGQFLNKNGKALDLERAEINGNVFLRNGFKAEGKVFATGITVGGNFECSNSQFLNKNGEALDLERAKINGSVFLRNSFKAEGEVYAKGITVGSNFECSNSQFLNKNGKALDLERANIGGYVFLRNEFKAEGEVFAKGITVGNSFECDNSQFLNKNGKALDLERAKINGSVFLRNGFKAEGKVLATAITVGSTFDCNNGEFINKNKITLDIERINIKGHIFLSKKFKAEGEVYAKGITVGGNFECSNSQFLNKNGKALDLERAEINGSVFLRNGFKAEGEVNLFDANIKKTFYLTKINSPETMTLDLRSCEINNLRDELKSYPAKGNLFLYGLVYNEIHDKAPKKSSIRIEWLRRQPSESFHPQPYVQLANTLKKEGYSSDAKKILFLKEKDRARFSHMSITERLWYYFLWTFIGFGYQPIRIIIISFFIVLFGSLLFHVGFNKGIIVPTQKTEYLTLTNSTNNNNSKMPPAYFNAFIYSLDVFIPIVDLQQAGRWLPNPKQEGEIFIRKQIRICITGEILYYYLWFQIIMGWLITTLLVANITGLIRK